MKRKIGELRNVPIVEGDKNLVRGGAEIHINDLKQSGSSSSNVSKYAPRYFSIDWDKASEDWRKLLSIISDVVTNDSGIAMNIASTYKIDDGNLYIISAYPVFNDGIGSINNLIGFSYLPVYIDKVLVEAFGLSVKHGLYSFEDIIENISTILNSMGIELILSMEGITEITEEEYYKVD